jgi:Trk-type K+ transport system membrane component
MMQQQSYSSWVHRLSPAKLLLLFYLIAIVISTTVLSLPVAYKPDVHVAFIDRVFVAVSALSVTGLTPVSIADSFSVTGIILLALIMHLGAVGVMTVSTFIWMIIGKKIGIAERRLIMRDQNQTAFGGMVTLIRQILLVVLVVELLGVVMLGTYYMQYFPTAKEAYFQGFFSTISAISNAGFGLNNDSLAMYNHDYFVQFIIMALIIFGAIGFPVLIEVKAFLFSRQRTKHYFRFSLFTKVTTVTFLFLIVIGTIGIYVLDFGGYMKGKGLMESFFYALFQSVTTRSAGLTTMDVSLLTEPNHLFMSALMFIGASPSSAGGGIRTTTFALVVIFIITYARGGRSVKVFNRQIYDRDLLKAVTVMVLAIAFIFVSVVILLMIEPFTLSEIIFEVTSAFGTVGLSLGITSELTTFSKILLMVLMFIGRIGVITFLYTFRKEIQNDNYIRYPKERIIIG